MASASVKQPTRRKSAWLSSKWAKKISSLVIGGDKKKKKNFVDDDIVGLGGLVNTSNVSSALASGDVNSRMTYTASASINQDSNDDDDNHLKGRRTNKSKSPDFNDINKAVNLSILLSIVIARWGGGGGGRDIDEKIASRGREPFITNLLNTLCFSTNLVKSIWFIISSSREAKQVRYRRETDNEKISTKC